MCEAQNASINASARLKVGDLEVDVADANGGARDSKFEVKQKAVASPRPKTGITDTAGCTKANRAALATLTSAG